MDTISVKTLFFLLAVHFFADFCLQTQEQAEKKSRDFTFLLYHVCTYSLSWLLFLSCTESFIVAVKFSLITFFAHLFTDAVTSKIGKPFWEKEDYHNGFVVVGADQVLHYVQLILTYQWVTAG